MSTSSKPLNETQLAGRFVEIIGERLPRGWSVRSEKSEAEVASGPRPDLAIEVAAPNGSTATIMIEVKRILESRDIEPLRTQLDAYQSQVPNSYGLVGARYLSPPMRARLAESGMSYVDATGNLRLEVADPGLFVSDRGADADPWRGPGRPRGTLKGAPAAKVVRAVADFSGDWAIRDLVETSKTSTGAAYRVVDFLESEGLATRAGRGVVSVPSWDKVLRRWSVDYGFVRNSQVSRWIAPRGLEDLVKRAAASSDVTYAVTGTLAAAEWAAYAPARSAMIYVLDSAAASEAWDLRPADAGANVMLAEPDVNIPFVRSLTMGSGLEIAAPTQVAVDLMTGPGRSPAEAEELIQWMVKNEQSWRN